MCGIVGCWNLNTKPLDKRAMSFFVDSLAHRGPDGRGLYFDINDSFFLGHRRLAILDLSQTGAQPMSSSDGRYVVTFNGEIYNFIEIQKELVSKGHCFRSSSDTEVLLAAYREWGEACQLKFNGMWAFAIWDSRQRRLFLSRDRFGVKPLHYWYDGSTFAFASELKAFLALPNWPYQFDPQGVGLSIVGGNHIEGTDTTILAGVKRLPAGYSLSIRQGLREPVVKRWWNTLDHLETPPASYDDRVEHFRELFEDACRIRMRSDVPIGTALSGGLDSSAVLGTISQLASKNETGERSAPDWHTSFVSGYPNSPQDETAYAKMMLEQSGANGEFMVIDPNRALEELESIIFSSEEIFPFRGTVWFLYRLMRERGIVVSIDGHGGDELLAGYHHYPIFRMLDAANASQPGLPYLSPLRNCMRSLFSNGEISPNHTPNKYIPGNLPSSVKRFRTCWLAEPVYTSQFINYIQDEERLKSASHLQRGLYYDFHCSNLPTILRNFDRFSMAHGVEIRAPFMDWRLVSFGFSLPDDDRIGGGFTKRILRDSTQNCLPDAIRLRTEKIGFLEPFAQWQKNGFANRLLDITNEQSFLECPLWDGPLIRGITEKTYREEQWNKLHSPWLIANAHLLMQTFQRRRTESLSN